MLNSRRIENYLRFALHRGDLSSVLKGASDVRVSNLKAASGGVTNEVYFFLLTLSKNGFEQHFDLVLKTYPEPVDFWFKTYRPNEEVRKYVREFQALRSLEEIGFPVPHVYLCECDSFFLGYPFVIMQKEKATQESIGNLDAFAASLARLHNLKVDELGIRSLKFPKDDSTFAKEWLFRFRQVLGETRHYRRLRKDFENAIYWLEMNASHNNCPRYSLIHGEYHPGHTIMTSNNVLKVIDWERVAIGDPAFDVGYAYHVVKLLNDERNPNSGERAAEYFISEYSKKFQGNIHSRLKFYQVVGLLGVTIAVSSLMSKPLEAYRRFGYKALAWSIAIPFDPLKFLARRWLKADFIVSYLQYCHEFIRTTLRQ